MSGSTVLIVDDERTLARAIKAYLTESGYEAEVAGDDLGGLARPELRRADDRVGPEADAGEERSKSLGLTLALGAQWPGCVVTGPALRVAGVGVAEEVELGRGGSTVGGAHPSRVARNAVIRPRRSARVAR